MADPKEQEATPNEEEEKRRRVTKRKPHEKRKQHGGSKRLPPVASGSAQAPNGAIPYQEVGSTGGASAPSGSETQPTDKAAEKPPSKKPPPPSYPPAPTRYLYHLVNQETGDHFATTEASTASEYQAMGYEGGAIARVYSYQEKDTKAISTNQGTAYIFTSSAAKTEPASQVVTLWYSTNGSDFFYTTNEAEAKRSGWQGSAIGYARSL
jgi:hypothetical protein